ncbi:uncharacterized protein LOC106759714 [Vigna radiata var. radiata]|uniref:Uncharacterized protein LOC106759714 n=1 Tax=Vigna radiata var. radiata TaxID=3916 RepID=A0A1S3TXM5_VIGRR|nr:uncharacterized protein LOC106759714 [Vigna radiata var. radiata]
MQHQLDAISKRLDTEAKAKGKQSHGHDHGSSKKNQEDKALDPNLAMLKLTLPSFKGEADPSVFLNWIAKVDHIFDLYSVKGHLREKLVCLALEGQAKQWLRRRYLIMASPASTWEHFRDISYECFVPPYYHRDLLIKFQQLTQDRRSVEEYARELEVLLHCANLKENNHEKIVRFISGLNSNIQDIIEFHDDETLDVVVRRAMKVEKKLLKKEACHNKISKSSRGVFYKSSSSKDKTKDVSKEAINKSSSNHSSSPPKSSFRPSHIKFFKCLGHGHIAFACPNKRAMCIRGEEVVTDDSPPSSPSHTSHSSSSSSEDEYKVSFDGDLLVIRRLLGQVHKDFDTTQRENIFHTRCLIASKVCSMIIAKGSCTNVASTRVVDKLKLPTIAHAKPYKLQWLSEEGEILVKKKVHISFSISKYQDEVLCDVVPMEATHILLGRPWQFDRNVQHDGLTNRMSFTYQGCKYEEAEWYWFAFISYSIKKLIHKNEEAGKEENVNSRLSLCLILRAAKLNITDFFKELPQFVVKAGPTLSNIYGTYWENKLEAKEIHANVIHLKILSKPFVYISLIYI